MVDSESEKMICIRKSGGGWGGFWRFCDVGHRGWGLLDELFLYFASLGKADPITYIEGKQRYALFDRTKWTGPRGVDRGFKDIRFALSAPSGLRYARGIFGVSAAATPRFAYETAVRG